MSPLVLSDSSSSTGCHGTDVAEALSVHFPPDRSVPGSSGESAPGRSQSTSGSTILAGPSMVLGPDFSPRRLLMVYSHQEGLPLTGGGLSPLPGDVKIVGVAPEGAHLIASGLSTEVVETLLQSRVDPIHLKSLCCGNLGLPHLAWWAVSGQKSPSYTFPPRCVEAETYSTVPCSTLEHLGARSSL